VLSDPQGALFALYMPLNAMSDAQEPKRGEFSWHELMTSDPNAAFAFYAELFGWTKTTAMDMGDQGTYQMFGPTPEVPVGGMYRTPAGLAVPPNRLPYILVDSANAAAERVKASGGDVKQEPMDIPGGGRIAVCVDPQGAVCAVHSLGS